ncbi:hypothetical protein ENH_00036800 [Eimeria necatrix]|uniref:Uncharacterized protein n=1 Tax=Eimeria necatrix TaxID=51315 RepID=U6MGN7_9EIME|nr:hypothetical protein ENH_00036800 [Eimeria necatrix]CDJ63181.1 hypothetical protein ENH_00036800 [Eimeria necatrix]
MAFEVAFGDACKDKSNRFLASSRYGATSASVEADARFPRCSLPEDTSKLSNILSSSVSCDMNIIPFSSPEQSPAANTIFPLPAPCTHSDNASPLGAVPWLMHPATASRCHDEQKQKCSGDTASSSKPEGPPWPSFPRGMPYPERKLLLPAIAEPSVEDCSSDSSVSTAGDATDSSSNNWLKSISSDFSQETVFDKGVLPPPKCQKAVNQASTRQDGEGLDRGSPCPPFWPYTSCKTAPEAPSTWSPSCEGAYPGGLQIQWSVTESFREQIMCRTSTSSQNICESRSLIGTSSTLVHRGNSMRCGTIMPPMEYLDDANDGRSWLEHLEKLRGGAPKEEYKRERTRIVDALIRRAATYPKISGIYFDKHQVQRYYLRPAVTYKLLVNLREIYGHSVFILILCTAWH